MIDILQSGRSSLLIIAGPCVAESAELCLQIGRHVQQVCQRLQLSFVFKASFDKANRSSNSSYRGPGMVEGLKFLRRVKDELKVPVLTDVHEVAQVAPVAEVADVLQVPAFLARQTDLLTECGKTGKWVNIKKGQFMSPAEMGNAAKKVQAAGNNNILLTERGTFFGYNRLVNDFTGLSVMRDLGHPVIFDITHSTQQPAGLGDQSGGNPKYSLLLARAAVAAGVDGLFLECHPRPAESKSDAASILPLEWVDSLLTQARQLADLRATWNVSGNVSGKGS